MGDGRTDRRTDRWTDGRMDGQAADRQRDRGMDRRMEKWTEGQTDGRGHLKSIVNFGQLVHKKGFVKTGNVGTVCAFRTHFDPLHMCLLNDLHLCKIH